MNARIPFSVAVSWIALLPSPSVCQGDGNVAQNSPPAYNARPNQYYTAHNPRQEEFPRQEEPPPQEEPTRQEAPQNGSPDRNNSYYSVPQEAPQSSSPDRNNDYYSIRQETPFDGLSNWANIVRRYKTIENTDENRPFDSRDCLLPEQPEGGHYKLRGCDEPCSKCPNDLVPETSVLTYTCKDKYILSGNNISVCISQRWTPPSSCHKICSPLRSTSVDISCSHKGETVSYTKHVLPGIRATLACKPSYTLPLTNDPAYREITCLDNSLWNNQVFRCLPGVYCCMLSICKNQKISMN